MDSERNQAQGKNVTTARELLGMESGRIKLDTGNKLCDMAVAKAQVKPGIKFEPLWDWCLLDPIIAKTTKGGIHLPDKVSEDDTGRSEIVAVGPGTYRDDGTFVPVPLKLGDIVYNMTKMHKIVVKIDGHVYIAVSCRDLVGVERKVEETVDTSEGGTDLLAHPLNSKL